jgi:acetyl esterase/lipase
MASGGVGGTAARKTEAQYAVAMESFTNPAVRNFQIHDILRMQFDEGDLGPFGYKGIEALMARFDRDCTDKALREDVDRSYRQGLEARKAALIRVYKTVDTTTLDAHVFPASGAKPAEKRPAFLFFHGGSWAAGMPEWGYQHCQRYAKLGLVGISFEYRLSWRHGTTPLDSVKDAKSAVRWVRTHADDLGIDPARIIVAGFSAGGHLAADVDVADDSWVKECLAGRGSAAEISPANYIQSGLPPAIVFHGLEDPLCPFPKTEAFCKNMKTAGNRCELNTFKGGHFRSKDEWATIYEKTDEFLTSLGFLDASARSSR